MSTTAPHPPTLTVAQIDERIRALQRHIQEWHQGHEVTATPMKCRERIDTLLDARHALTHPCRSGPA